MTEPTDLLDQARERIAERRALLAAGTGIPWAGPEEVTGGRSGAMQLFRVFSVPFRETGEFADEVADCLDSPDATLIVAAVNAFAPSLDLIESVLDRHYPVTPRYVKVPDWCHRCSTTAWPCPDARAALVALGVLDG